MTGTEPPRAVAEDFYAAMARRDHAAMGALYDDAAGFSDPAFGALNAFEVRAMWAMLLSRSKDISVSHAVVTADEGRVVTRWNADYTFTRTGRPVKNRVTATMDVRGGKIIRHADDFDLRDWMRQALGLPALMLGWLPAFRAKVTGGARTQLDAFMKKQGSA